MISVIIPVYNNVEYLERLDACLRQQTYKDFEVIYVDDGSTDGSAEMLDQLTAKKDNYVVIHKGNGGLSSARNAGICRARGEWLTLIDADDTVEDGYLETLLSHTADDIDLVIGGVAEVDENDRLVEPLFSDYEGLVSISTAMTWCYKPKYFFGGCAWGKLYRTEVIIVGQLFFDDNKRYAEDILFSIQYLAHVNKKIYFTTKPVYHYNKGNQASIMHNITVENLITEVDSYERMCKMVLTTPNVSVECRMRACIDTYKKYRCLLSQIHKTRQHIEVVAPMRKTVNKTLGFHRIYCWLLWHVKFK